MLFLIIPEFKDHKNNEGIHIIIKGTFVPESTSNLEARGKNYVHMIQNKITLIFTIIEIYNLQMYGILHAN